jgi:hypothetical protein
MHRTPCLAQFAKWLPDNDAADLKSRIYTMAPGMQNKDRRELLELWQETGASVAFGLVTTDRNSGITVGGHALEAVWNFDGKT